MLESRNPFDIIIITDDLRGAGDPAREGPGGTSYAPLIPILIGMIDDAVFSPVKLALFKVYDVILHALEAVTIAACPSRFLSQCSLSPSIYSDMSSVDSSGVCTSASSPFWSPSLPSPSSPSSPSSSSSSLCSR